MLVGDSLACWCLRSFFRFGPFFGERVSVSVLMASAMMPFLLGLSLARGIVGGTAGGVVASCRKLAEG